jgi:predicted DNA-binding ribbon-helix-helix protein
MKSAIVKHSMNVDRHRTSVYLEEDFWKALREIAISQGETVPCLVARINAQRKHANLSSAIRLFVLGFYRERSIRPLGLAPPLCPSPDHTLTVSSRRG